MAASETPDSVDVKAIAQSTNLTVDIVRYFAARTEKTSTGCPVRDEKRVTKASLQYCILTDDVLNIYASPD